jgi:hypothetical protein
MLTSPFAFFRRAAAILAADLSRAPTIDFSWQLSGEAHLSNFGVFSAPNRRLVFDRNVGYVLIKPSAQQLALRPLELLAREHTPLSQLAQLLQLLGG